MCAIMGSSGAGKTTLLDILAGRQKSGHVGGKISYFGRPKTPSIKRLSGYVMQDDLLMPTMTVKECLSFAAKVRLPEHMSWSEKEERINWAMKELSITEIADRYIGGTLRRGISGGEKRRVSIAMELLTEPTILFLDEPTSGLDAYNAQKVMECLSNLTMKGITVICSIHQPRSSVYNLFDYLVLLSDGYLAYFGKANLAADHFTKLGYEIPEGYNVPDFLIDVLEKASRQPRSPKATISKEMAGIIQSYKEMRMCFQDYVPNNEPNKLDLELEKTLDKLDENVSTSKSKDCVIQNPFYSEKCDEMPENAYMTSFPYQFITLSQRAFNNFLRNPFLMPAHLIVCILMGGFLGYVYYQQKNNLAGTQNRIGAVLFTCIVLGLGAMTSLELFIAERAIFIREIASGYYRPWAYFLSKVIFDVIPLRIIPPIIMGSIEYWLIGLRNDWKTFLWFLFILVLLNIVCGAVCLIIGSLFQNVAASNLIAISYILYSMLFAGVFINNETAGFWRFASPFQYAVEVLMTNELIGRKFLFDPGNIPPILVDGEVVLKHFKMYAENFTRNVLVLSGMGVGFLIIAGIIVQLVSKERR